MQRWKKTLESGGDFNLAVASPIDGYYRVVGSTYPAEHPQRQNASKVGTGYRGFLAERKVAGYVILYQEVEYGGGDRPVFDTTGKVIGKIPRGQGRESGILSTPTETEWRYVRPVFEKSVANPWSTRVVGLIGVHSSADYGERHFKTAEFQRQVDSIASEVSPYLDAIQVLVGEENRS